MRIDLYAHGDERLELSDEPEEDFELFDRESGIRHLLEGFRHDQANVALLRLLLLPDSVPRSTDEEVIGEVIRRIVWGRIRVRRKVLPRSTFTAPEEKRSTEEPAPPPKVVPPPPAETTHWVEISVVDDETGEPVNNVRLRVSLPDGKEPFMTTKGERGVRVEDVPAGSCDITWMTYDEALEVVAVAEE